MYLTVYFGLELDEKVFPCGGEISTGLHHHGPQGLLLLLETHLGLFVSSSAIDYLRIAQYRQALQQYLKQSERTFYRQSFEADELATAEEVLNRRDELKLAGWDFMQSEKIPDRLADMAGVEKELSEADYHFEYGFADRFIVVLNECRKQPTPIRYLYLNEPRHLLPGHFQRLFECLEMHGTTVQQMPEPVTKGENDLAVFQRSLSGVNINTKARKDGSLLLIKARRETDVASFLAKKIRRNTTYRPFCVIPEKNRALDNALIQEGLPSLGILSASLARPTLQIIKLVTTFLWRPIDPNKVLEFVTLPIKPLESDLAVIIARQIARRPGLNSESWYAAISRYFEEKEAEAQNDSGIKVDRIRNEYRFWFERRRYNITKSIPKEEVIEVFEYISEWASKKYESENNQNTSLLVLSDQSRRIRELLEELPEAYNFLTNLELERIVRTIYQPSPVMFQEMQVGHLNFVYHPSALIGPADDVLWWNFSQKEQSAFFSRWYQSEINYLQSMGLDPEMPEKQNKVLIWQRKRPVFQCQNRLILVIPEKIEGHPVLAHPLLGDLIATFENLEEITFSIDDPDSRVWLNNFFTLPEWIQLPRQLISAPAPVLEIEEATLFDEREHETFTSLESLFYYPYQWIFRHKVRLHKSALLSVVGDNTLKGNLAHRFIELLLKREVSDWQKTTVENWIDEMAPRLFAREAATLLMYGREPERLAFLNTIKYAAWSLVTSIQENGWKVKATEMDLDGAILGIPLKGKADLVLKRGSELAVVDLKWRGSSWRKQSIKNEEDLQLVMYARLLSPHGAWAHTAYFILEKGEMIARNNQAFKNCTAVNPNCDHQEVNQRIWTKMEATLRWRLSQLKNGQIEIRTEQTQDDLEDLYEGQLMDLLEMKAKNAPFEDYEVLIGLVN